MVSDAIVEEVRSRADLIDICGAYTSLKRVGKSYRGPCPLHGGDGPNFSVDADRGIFKCFVCGEGGDVFGFLMKHLGLDFPSAVRQVAARVGVEIPERGEREDPHGPARQVLAFAAEWFQERLGSEAGAPARAYLSARGLEPEAAARFGVGFAPPGWRGLREAAGAHGISDGELLDLGLLATSERAEEPYDRFRNRLMFPIHDVRDRPIGFGGRALESDDRAPKYINSPDSPLFHKGEELYGLNWARHAIRREGFAALVEGFMDVIALHASGLAVAVAGLGTAFTAQQGGKLSALTDRVYLLYDSDSPGLKATFKTADIALRAGLHPFVVTLPAGEDPDSIVRSGGLDALNGYMEDAVDVLERKLQILERGGYLEGVEGRRRAIDGLLSTLRAVRDPALRDIYLERVVERTGVRRDTLVHEIARVDRERMDRPTPVRDHVRGPRPAASAASPIERDLLLLSVRDPRLAAEAARLGLGPEHFVDRTNAELFEALLATSAEAAETDDVAWVERLAAEVRVRARGLLDDLREVTDPAETFAAAVRRLLFAPDRARLEEIDRELGLADPAQQRKLLLEKQEITARLRDAGESRSFLPRSLGGA